MIIHDCHFQSLANVSLYLGLGSELPSSELYSVFWRHCWTFFFWKWFCLCSPKSFTPLQFFSWNLLGLSSSMFHINWVTFILGNLSDIFLLTSNLKVYVCVCSCSVSSNGECKRNVWFGFSACWLSFIVVVVGEYQTQAATVVLHTWKSR